MFQTFIWRGVYADVGKGQKGGAVYKTMDEVDNWWGPGMASHLMAFSRKLQGGHQVCVFLVFFIDMWFYVFEIETDKEEHPN